MSQDSWKAIAAAHQKPSLGKATWQLVTTVGAYVATWYLMYLTLSVSWWLTIPLAVLAGGLLVRVFIIFHDCGHGSFFASSRANDFWGILTGLLAFTPYYHWRAEHAIHHGTTGDLDRRGTGDVWTMTVREYLGSSRMKRLAYRFIRNPFILLAVAPLALFLFWERVPSPGMRRRERRSVWYTNVLLLAIGVGMSMVFGFLPYLFLQLIVMAVAGGVGVWLFYVQHQFEDAYWERKDNWDFVTAALEGSTFLKLPRVLQWFTGNIGFHHIHHPNSKIPNYNLQACHESHQVFQVKPMTMLKGVLALRLGLWDEKSKKLIRFRHIKQAMAA